MSVVVYSEVGEEFGGGVGEASVQIFQILLTLMFALIFRHIPLVSCIFNNLSSDKTRRI
jgi:hypothetical protein